MINTWYIACVLCLLAATRIGANILTGPPEDEQVMLETCRGR
jgi:hypothetical protein